LNGTADVANTFPESWRPAVEAALRPGERLLAWFEPDLDERLFYASGLVVLTDRRLLGAIVPRQTPAGLSHSA